MSNAFDFLSSFSEKIKGIGGRISRNFPSEVEIIARNIVETAQVECGDYNGSRIILRRIKYYNGVLAMKIEFADAEAVDRVIKTIRDYVSIMDGEQREIFEGQIGPLEVQKQELLPSSN